MLKMKTDTVNHDRHDYQCRQPQNLLRQGRVFSSDDLSDHADQQCHRGFEVSHPGHAPPIQEVFRERIRLDEPTVVSRQKGIGHHDIQGTNDRKN